jgi:hypothetical protein
MILSEKIRAEALVERPCPTCGAERAFRYVWRNVDPLSPYGSHSRGTLELVCEVHGPFDDPSHPLDD